jgi:hypothetical protein
MTEPKRFDLAALAASSKPAERVMTAGNLNGPENPFLSPVRESYRLDQGTPDSGWMEITIPSDQFDDVVNSLRALSAWFGKVGEPIGVHIRAEYAPDGAETTTEVGPKDFDDIPKDGRDVYLKYTGRARLARGRRGKRQADAQQPATGLVNGSTDDAATDVEMASVGSPGA